MNNTQRQTRIFGEAFSLAQELIHGTPNVTQNQVLILLQRDFDNKFLRKLLEIIAASSDTIREMHHLQYDQPHHEMIATLQQGIATLQYIAMCCEGHFRPMQDIMRYQENHGGSVDMIKTVVALSIQVCENSEIIQSLSFLEVNLLRMIFKFLTEMMQGPCKDIVHLVVNL